MHGSTPIYGNTELPYSSPDDQHHYFVLDPEVVDDRPPYYPGPPHDTLAVNSATIESDNGLRFPTPPPPLPEATLPGASNTVGGGKATVSARRQSPDGKERDEARDVGVDDELSKNHRGRSIHEIPLRPTRDGQSAAVVVGGPVCDDSGIDMGTSSWPWTSFTDHTLLADLKGGAFPAGSKKFSLIFFMRKITAESIEVRISQKN